MARLSFSPMQLADRSPARPRVPAGAVIHDIGPAVRPALRVEHVGHRYGRTPVLQDVGFDLAPGEILCLVGPSGCGKTTTLRLVAGLEDVQEGCIRIAGRTVSGEGLHVPVEARNIGLLFQDYALFPHMRVIDNVMFGIRDASGRERRQRALAALAEVGLSDYAGCYPHMLSGGQQQRVALARALAPRPAMLLLDEPFTALDSQLRRQVRDDTMHLLKTSGAATLLVTHDPEEAMFMADRIAVMRDGRIEQIGTPVEIYCCPASAFVAGFFGEVNRLTGIVAGGRVTTPFGRLAAGGLADGTTVEVLIRPEAIGLDAAGTGPHARVEAARMLGRTSLIHLSLPAGEGEVHLHARVPGRRLPREGELLAVSLDREQAFIFPRGERT